MKIVDFYRQAPASTLISAAIIGTYLITAVQSKSIQNNLWDSSLADAWILWIPGMTDGFGPLRAIGAAFLHFGPGHMLLNLILLWLLGREIEGHFGSVLFSLMYFSGAIGASAAIVWFDPNSLSAGASGAVYALMAILVGLFARRGADLRAPLVLIAVNVAYTFLADNVSLWGHLGGLFTGALLAVALGVAKTVRAQWLVSIAVFIAVVIFLWAGIS